jgi:hypothetical protein
LTVPNHNFSPISTYWIRIDGIISTTPVLPQISPETLNFYNSGNIYKISKIIDENNFEISTFNPSTNNFTIVNWNISDTYLGGGTISIIQNFDIQTKVFAPFYEQGTQNLVPYIDIFSNATASGQYICDVYLNENDQAVNDPIVNPSISIIGTNIISTAPENPILYPQQTNQSKIWHRFFSPYISQSFQLEFKMSDAQMSAVYPVPPQIPPAPPLPPPNYTITINNNDFVMHAMTLYLAPTSRMTQ